MKYPAQGDLKAIWCSPGTNQIHIYNVTTKSSEPSFQGPQFDASNDEVH